MKYCQTCGGEIGVDCFNPEECAYIDALEKAKKERERKEMYQKAKEMERKIKEMEKKIEDLQKKETLE